MSGCMKLGFKGQPKHIVYASHSSGGKEICKRFNSRRGCYSPICKFEHICAIPGCDQAHYAQLHSSTQPPKKLTVKPLRDLNLAVWQHELLNDVDKSFLLHGIQNGFNIISQLVIKSFVSSKNHPSANPKSPLYKKAHAQILTEIENDNYLFAKSTPKIISPFGNFGKARWWYKDNTRLWSTFTFFC